MKLEVLWGNVRHIDLHSSDRHYIAKELTELFNDLYKLQAEGTCFHKPSNVVVQASGDMANRVQGTYCRICFQRIKMKVIEWELDGTLPSAPTSIRLGDVPDHLGNL
jgi:hypothetical protein